MDVINKQTISDWRESRKKTLLFEDKITDRITYVLTTLFEAFNYKINCWYFEGACEGEVGDLYKNIDDCNVKNLNVFVITNNRIYNSTGLNVDPITIINNNNEEWGWDGEFPVRWLFEDGFKEEIEKGKERFLKKDFVKKLLSKS